MKSTMSTLGKSTGKCMLSHTTYAHCENRRVSKAQSFSTLRQVVHIGATGQTVIQGYRKRWTGFETAIT